MNEYDGKWRSTYTGKQFHFLDPQPDEICIEDIAHALSLTCRFGGACKQFYSVADHSIRVSEIVPEEYKLLALLHDGAEAYLADIVRPMKNSLPGFKEMENVILVAIFDKFIPFWIDDKHEIYGTIKEADNIILATEARDLMTNMNDWASLPQPLPDKIKPMSSRAAEVLFLMMFADMEAE